MILLAAERWRRWPRWRRSGLPVATGVFAALADHKLVFLPAALALHAVMSGWRTYKPRHFLTGIHATAAGFAIGIAVFWTWGLSISAAAFIQDHLHDHLLDRITHVNPLGYSSYPSPFGLWLEFARHTAYVSVPVSVCLLIGDVFFAKARSLRRWGPSRGSWLVWIVLTSVAFTLVDWRMTKHLIPLLLPMLLGFAPNRDAPRWRAVVPAIALIVAVAFNAYMLGGLVRNFENFKVTPVW